MKKFYMIASALMLLTFFTIDRSIQEESNTSKSDAHWKQTERDSRALFGVVITWDRNLVYEKYIGSSTGRNNNKTTNLTDFGLRSMFAFEFIDRLKIDILVSKNIYEFVNSFDDLFTLKTSSGEKLKGKSETPSDATVAKFKEAR